MKRKKFQQGMVYFIVLVIVLMVGCTPKVDLYSLKTDVSKGEEVEKVVRALDWKDENIEKVTVADKDITVHMEGENPGYSSESLQTVVHNGITLLVLVENAENIHYEYDTPFFTMDRETTDELLKNNFQQSIEEFRKSKEDFKELQKKLPSLKPEEGKVYIEHEPTSK